MAGQPRWQVDPSESLEAETARLARWLTEYFDNVRRRHGESAVPGVGPPARRWGEGEVDWARVVDEPARGVEVRVAHWSVPLGRFLRIFVAPDEGTGRIFRIQTIEGIDVNHPDVYICEKLETWAFNPVWREDPASGDLWVELYDPAFSAVRNSPSLEGEAGGLGVQGRFDYERWQFPDRVVGYRGEIRSRQDAQQTERARVVDRPSRGVEVRLAHWSLPKGRHLRIFVPVDPDTDRINTILTPEGLTRVQPQLDILVALKDQTFADRWREDPETGDLWVSLYPESH